MLIKLSHVLIHRQHWSCKLLKMNFGCLALGRLDYYGSMIIYVEDRSMCLITLFIYAENKAEKGGGMFARTIRSSFNSMLVSCNPKLRMR
jgi:hypothetical protein